MATIILLKASLPLFLRDDSLLPRFQVQKGPLGGNAAQWLEDFCRHLKFVCVTYGFQAAVTESQIVIHRHVWTERRD